MFFRTKKTEDTIHVSNMNCQHCVKRIEDGLKKINVKVLFDLDNKNIVVKYDDKKISLDQIKETIKSLGYEC